MAEALLGHLRVQAHLEHQRGAGVPKVVKPDVGQPRTPEEQFEGAVDHATPRVSPLLASCAAIWSFCRSYRNDASRRLIVVGAHPGSRSQMAIGRELAHVSGYRRDSGSKDLHACVRFVRREAVTGSRLAAEKCAEPGLRFELPGQPERFPEGNLVCGKHGLPDRGFKFLEPRNRV